MASSFVQVIWAPVKTSFLDGSAPVSAFAEALHGMSSPRWGLAQEDEALAAIALTFNSADELKASQAKATVERKVGNHLSGAPYDYKMVTTPGFDDVFSAPVVEVVTWFWPLPMVTPEFEAQLPENFQKFAAGLKAAPEHLGGASAGWGLDEVDRNGQRCKTFTGFLGWESAAAHRAARETPPFLDHIHYLRQPGHAGVTMLHFSFAASP